MTTATEHPTDVELRDSESIEESPAVENPPPMATPPPLGETLPWPPEEDDDVIELELFHPEEDLEEPATSRGTIPGTIAAVVLHIWLLATLHHLVVHEEIVPGVEPGEMKLTEIEPDPEKKVEQQDPKFVLVQPNDEDKPVQPILNARSVGVARNKNPEMLSPPDPKVDEINPELTRRKVFDIPEGIEVSDTIVVQGSTGNSIIQLESALDRVTHEIAMNLKEKRVLLVWLLDASASLEKQREVIVKRLDRIYGELDALKEAGQIPRTKEPLLTGVVSFGRTTNYLTRQPTPDFATIKKAVESVKVDETGRENVFTAVSQTLRTWGKHRDGRRIMLVTVTDESGDDFEMLETSIRISRRYGAKAYVIGPSAVFGRREGYVPYVAPENGKTYQIPVDLGPETAKYDNLVMPFWFEGPQYNYLSSGYGPYGLSRLVTETGGIYFTTNTLTMKGLTPVGRYETEQIKPFEPDYHYSTPQQYEAELKKHPLRYAVTMAARYSRENKPEGTPQLELRVTPQNFRTTAAAAQRTAARSQYMVDAILRAFPDGIDRLLDREQSPRWRMNFCLTYGRLLAMRVRCLEYNSACADLKSNLSPQDVGSKANHWIFRPTDEIHYATSERRNAKLAKQLLERVVREAPGTPWAKLAKRELRHPFGIRVVKRFIPPPKPKKRAANNNGNGILLAPDPKKPRPAKPKPKPIKPKLPRY